MKQFSKFYLLIGLLTLTLGVASSEVIVTGTQYNLSSNLTIFSWDTAVDSGEYCFYDDGFQCLVVNISTYSSTTVTNDSETLQITSGNDYVNISNNVFPLLNFTWIDSASGSLTLNNGTGFDASFAYFRNNSMYLTGNNDVNPDASQGLTDYPMVLGDSNTNVSIVMMTDQLDSGNWRADFTTGIYEVDIVNETLSLIALPGIDMLTQTGNTAVNYSWDNWTWISISPVDYSRYWDFNEGTGTNADDKSSNDKDLTGEGVPAWGSGKQSWGTDLNGTSGFWSTTDFTGFSDDTDGSICNWFKLTAESGVQQVFALSTNDTDYNTYFSWAYTVGAETTAITVYMAIGTVQYWAFDARNDLMATNNDWNHICITRNDTTIKWYRNAEEVNIFFFASTNKSKWFTDVINDATNPANELNIGAFARLSGHLNYFNGTIDDLRIYSRALRQAEVTRLYGQGLPDTLSNSYNSSYNDYSTNNSIAEILGNLSISPYTKRSFTSHELFSGATYNNDAFNYSTPISNDFNIEPSYPLHCENCFINNPLLQFNITTNNNFMQYGFAGFETSLDFWGVTGQSKALSYDDYWQLDGTLTNEVSGNNALESTDTTYNTNGIINQSLVFNLSAFANTTFPFNDTDANKKYSFNFWIKPFDPETNASDQYYFNARIDGGTVGRFHCKHNDIIICTILSNGDIRYDLAYEVNKSYMITLTFDEAQDINLYINTKLVNTTTSVSAVSGTVDTLRLILGAQDDGSEDPVINTFRGEIDEFRYYNEEMNRSIINDIFLQGTKLLNYSTTNLDSLASCSVFNNKTLAPLALELILFDEQNESNLTGDVDFSFVNLDNTTITYNGTSNDLHVHEICIIPNTGSVKVNGSLNYFATSYASRFHYLINTTFTNSSRIVNLLDLLSAQATVTNIIVEDETGEAVDDVLVLARREYIDQGAFKDVSMGITDNLGKCALPLEFNDVRYNFQIINLTDGNIIKDSVPLILTTGNTDPELTIKVSLGIIFDVWNRSDNIIFNTSISNASNIINFTVNILDINGLASSVQVDCVDVGFLGNNLTQTFNVTASSASITCNLGNITNKLFMITTTLFYPDGANFVFVETIDGNIPFAFSNDGLIAGAFILIALSFGFTVGPVASIMAMVAGLMVIGSLGFTLLNMDTIMMLIFSLLFITWLLRRKR